jgi:hypothetical protein
MFINLKGNPMNILRNALIALLLCSTTAIAAPANDSSIKQLLAVTQAQKLLEGMRAQFDSIMDNAVQQSLQGRKPTPKQQQAITKMKNSTIEIMQGELTWEKLEPMYLRLYKESFSEEEITGMLAFYETPTGQAVISKMPVLMQKTMQETQKMFSATTPKLQKVMKQFAAEMASASN